MQKFFATCARGLEPILATELQALDALEVEAGRGGVSFAGDAALLYRANLWLRSAVRVLKPVLEAHVVSPDDLYAAVMTVDWMQYLTPEHTLAVDCNVRDSGITHSQYAARRVKDAICDQFVARCGRRPSVDVERPMLGLNLHVYRDEAILSFDSSWDSLHKRGYRPILTKAPLNEALAAGLILTTGWKGDAPLFDPMCGSGSLPIEAAWIALRRPPGMTRKHFGFMGWMDYDVGLWAAIRDEARMGMLKKLPTTIAGSDIRPDAIEHAQGNARAAGIGHLVNFERKDLREFRPPDGPPGILICNPPYGERIGDDVEELRSLYHAMGEMFFERCRGWSCFVFTSDDAPWREIRLKRKSVTPFWNGQISCRLLRYDVT
ncbi:MAG: RNA methyltransferase [Gemmataceae bacterium]|nr:RNA methyltransferase [Gemmataceae bacterium]